MFLNKTKHHFPSVELCFPFLFANYSAQMLNKNRMTIIKSVNDQGELRTQPLRNSRLVQKDSRGHRVYNFLNNLSIDLLKKPFGL